MPSDKLQQITVKFEFDIADISEKEANELCEYISDYLIKHYNIVDYSNKVIYGE